MNVPRSPSRSPSDRSDPDGDRASAVGLRREARAVAAAAALLAPTIAACSGGFGVEDSDALVVYGQITDSVTASPVDDAGISVTAFSGNCGSNIFSSVSTSTDSAGRYGTSVINFRSGFRRCVEVEAVPPDGSGLESGLVRVPDVPLNDDAVVDSLRLDLALDSLSGR